MSQPGGGRHSRRCRENGQNGGGGRSWAPPRRTGAVFSPVPPGGVCPPAAPDRTAGRVGSVALTKHSCRRSRDTSRAPCGQPSAHRHPSHRPSSKRCLVSPSLSPTLLRCLQGSRTCPAALRTRQERRAARTTPARGLGRCTSCLSAEPLSLRGATRGLFGKFSFNSFCLPKFGFQRSLKIRLQKGDCRNQGVCRRLFTADDRSDWKSVRPA